MTLDELEHLERTVLEQVVQAITDYREQILTIFCEETDLPQDIAEDVTREALEAMGVSSISERLYGKVDYKKAMYAFLPRPQPVALMLDAKAEKSNGDRTATIQMSQTSITVRMRRAGWAVKEPGRLDQIIQRSGRELRVVTIVAKYAYTEDGESRKLDRIIVSCIPNGALQKRYNPTVDNSIWLAGRNAPSLGEDFRVRLSYQKLQEKAPWRVREIDLTDGQARLSEGEHPETSGNCNCHWSSSHRLLVSVRRVDRHQCSCGCHQFCAKGFFRLRGQTASAAGAEPMTAAGDASQASCPVSLAISLRLDRFPVRRLGGAYSLAGRMLPMSRNCTGRRWRNRISCSSAWGFIGDAAAVNVTARTMPGPAETERHQYGANEFVACLR